MTKRKIQMAAGVVALLATLAGCLLNEPVLTVPAPPGPGVFYPGAPQDNLGKPNPVSSEPAPTAELVIRGCSVGPHGEADRDCDPGARNPDVTQATIHQTICVPGWSASVRPPTSYTSKLRDAEMLTYYGPGVPATAVREDHLIAQSLGGHLTDPLNLWPQPVEASYAKDQDTRALRAKVCAIPQQMTLEAAQAEILAKWTH
jgi:hypothetical protein